jgi:Protein of unknown function (DUF1579)
VSIDPLLACTGRWSGNSTLRDPQNGILEECHSTALVAPVLGGRFARFDYTWRYKDSPQEGSILLGVDPRRKICRAAWIDSWHMGHSLMDCTGGSAGSYLSVRGSYPAPPGPDWGWRIDLGPQDDSIFRLVMYNVSPQGEEELAVDATYTRD